jgi:Uma2 family endonuclease
MATVPTVYPEKIDYPTSDGRPMAETDQHRYLMVEEIDILQRWYAPDPMVYVSGNLLIYYVPGNKRRHVSPDVFVVKGVANRWRDYYLHWEEKDLDLAIELTSSSTSSEDTDEKMQLYRDVLHVREYFLFDPREEYLSPSFQGFRLEKSLYAPIVAIQGRLPSEVLGLHLERSGQQLRFWHPATGQWLPTANERSQQQEAVRRQAEQERDRQAAARQRATEALQQAEVDRQREAEARQKAEADHQREAEARQKAEADRQREAEARQKAEADRQREAEARQKAEAELARVLAELERLRLQPPPQP